MATRTRTRYMDGIASRLNAHYSDRQHKSTTGIRVPYRRASTIDLSAEVGDGKDYGTIRLWRTVVLNPAEANPAREFAPARGAEIWVLNGQTHNTRSDRHFGSKRIGLDALIGHLVVEAELDGLSPDAKALVLTTGRHTRAERALGDQLEEAIDRDLAGDPRLKELNKELRDEAFRKAAEQRISGLDRALRAFNLLIKRKRTRRVKGTEDGGPRRPEPKALEPIQPLYADPKDVFQFRTNFRAVVHVQRGRRGSALLEVDAVDGYFDTGNATKLSLQFVPDIGEKLRIIATDSLEGGRMRIRFRAAPDAPLTTTELVASCLPPNAQAPLSASIPVEIVEARAARPKDQTRRKSTREEEIEEDAPPPVTVAYESESPTWAELGLSDWTRDTVGEYKKGVAYINGDYNDLIVLRQELPRERHDDITNLYIAPLAMTLVGLEESEANAPSDIALPEHFRHAALRAAALSSIFSIRYMNKTGLFDAVPDDEVD